MRRGPRAAAVDLTEGERAELERLLRRRGVGQALAPRIRIVLACAEPGATHLGVAKTLGVRRPAVAAWRRRLARHRLEGLVDAPRCGAPRAIDDEAVERLAAPTLEEAPRHATRWSTRAMARRHRSIEFRAFLDRVEGRVAPGLEVHLVLDDPKTHKTRLIHDGLVKRPRFHLHVTSASASPRRPPGLRPGGGGSGVC